MAEESRNYGGDGNDDNRFYEDIEAPKFADLAAPDPPRQDGASWFCIRIGCDQTHEEVDPDDLHRQFVLRVMAARSPNVRPCKASNGQRPSKIPRCPSSAPAKTMYRATRLSRITSIPEKQQRQACLNVRTPNVKTKVMPKLPIEKSLTTPRNKKEAAVHNQEHFQSAQHRRNRAADAAATAASSKCRVVKSLYLEAPATKDSRALASKVSADVEKKKKVKIGSAADLGKKGPQRPSSMKTNSSNPNSKKVAVIDGEKKEGIVGKSSRNIEEVLHPHETHTEIKEKVAMDDEDENKENIFGSIVAENTAPMIESAGEWMSQKAIDTPCKALQGAFDKGGGKCQKIKGTNPKPFRLRTNERGVMREANLEKGLLPQGLGQRENCCVKLTQRDRMMKGGTRNANGKPTERAKMQLGTMKKTAAEKLHDEASKVMIKRAMKSQICYPGDREMGKRTANGTRHCTTTAKCLWR